MKTSTYNLSDITISTPNKQLYNHPDHFVFPRLGLSSELSYNLRDEEDDKCNVNNWPALWTWFAVEVISLPVALLTPLYTHNYSRLFVCILYWFDKTVGEQGLDHI